MLFPCIVIAGGVISLLRKGRAIVIGTPHFVTRQRIMSRTVQSIFGIVFFGLLFAIAPLHAQKPFVYDFLRNDASARAAAMGGSFVTVTNDPSVLYYNPGALNTIDTTQISFTFFKHLLDINSGFATFATEVDGVGKIAAGVNYNNYGSFERTDKTGQEIGEFGSSDLAFSIGWANELGEGFSAGLSGNVILSTIDDYSSSALALGGGLHYQDTSRNLQAGLSILHLGSQVSSFGEETEVLPLDLKVGVSHQLRGLPLLIALNFSRLLDDSEDFLDRFSSFSIGGEFRISEPLRLRLGYNNRIRQDIAFEQSTGLGGLSGGFGVLIQGYRFDYAFNSLATLGGLHRISINTMF